MRQCSFRIHFGAFRPEREANVSWMKEEAPKHCGTVNNIDLILFIFFHDKKIYNLLMAIAKWNENVYVNTRKMRNTFTGVTILLSLTVFLNLVAESMPTTSDAVPLIGIVAISQSKNKKQSV